MNNVRLRLAPSPTGFLHIGNLRTALFGYFLAKSMNGKYILRIEDTDQKREVEGAVDSLLDILAWVGIKFDEGPHLQGGEYGPYIQSQRLEIYKKYTTKLLNNDKAYRCFCSTEKLNKMRANQTAKKEAPRYDRTCRHLSETDIKAKLANNEPFVVRQKMPERGVVIVNDELRGQIEFKAEESEDHVLVKSDGMPTYQMANVVDDHLMKISHITRGEEWIPSAPKNVLLYEAFGWEVPKLIHLPLILNKGGGKLSKRQGDVFVEDFKQLGYLPEALINFCILLGWHPEGDNEILNSEQIAKEFTIKGMGSSPAVFDLDKLDYFNGYYIRQMKIEDLVKACRPYLAENLKTAKPNQQTDEYLTAVVRLEQDRLRKLSDIGERTKLFFSHDLNYQPELLIWKKSDQATTKINLQQTLEHLTKVPDHNWTQGSLEETMMSYIKSKSAGVGDWLWPMRVALTGAKNSPGPFEVAEVLGKDLSLDRIKQAAELLS